MGEIDRNQTGKELIRMRDDERTEAMRPHNQPNDRGLRTYVFRDTYGVPCSIQDSSYAGSGYGAEDWARVSSDRIWLGTSGDDGEPMHLCRAQAADLAILLGHFARHGWLPDPEETAALFSQADAEYRENLERAYDMLARNVDVRHIAMQWRVDFLDLRRLCGERRGHDWAINPESTDYEHCLICSLERSRDDG